MAFAVNCCQSQKSICFYRLNNFNRLSFLHNLCPDFEGLIQQKIIYSISTIAAVVTKSVS